ncbi:hypothetical protein [Desulfovibrio sp. ZJ200]|nr:hypothetical protein [Desulfovibrio sp. ZJ200]
MKMLCRRESGSRRNAAYIQAKTAFFRLNASFDFHKKSKVICSRAFC